MHTKHVLRTYGLPHKEKALSFQLHKGVQAKENNTVYYFRMNCLVYKCILLGAEKFRNYTVSQKINALLVRPQLNTEDPSFSYLKKYPVREQ